MSSTVLFAINQRLWRLEKPLEDAREKVRRLEEDERTLTWMQKVEDARLRHVERAVRDLEPKGRVRRVLMRMIGVKRPDMVRDTAGILLEPVADELEELRKRLADARKEFCRLEGEGRVRTALMRMVEDVFATMKRQDDACGTDDYEEVWRLWEVEKAQRVRLHALWRIDPVHHDRGTWTAVSKEKRVPHGKGAAFPAMRAERATRERLKEARVRGYPSEIQRLEEEERMLKEMGAEIGGCVVSERFRPAGFLAPPCDEASRQKRVAA